MPDDNSRIVQLLEEALDSGRPPEDVCAEADCPELLWQVRERWEQCQRVQAQISAMFPSPGADEATDGNGRRPPPAPTDLPQVPGYEVQALLGRGGMGVVFKARHLALNRTVALKMILSGAYAGRDELTRFKREAEAVANLR